jgi:pimeloyl-ACP methyl ester carboxylesterase
VVIEQGAGEPARLWWPVQERVSAFAQVCTYDRAGYGWSDDAPRPRSIDDRVADLHALLVNAGLTAPFVLVAHSYGGLIVRRYAEKYPEFTAGLVLVDTAEEASLFEPAVLKFYSRLRGVLGVARVLARIGVLRLLAARVPLDAIGFPFVRAVEYAAAADDLTSVENAPASRRAGATGRRASHRCRAPAS